MLGSKLELAILRQLYNWDIFGWVENCPDYDLNFGNFTAEAKNDVYSNLSGNMAIEVWNSKKDKASGITNSISDVWIHAVYNPDRILMFSTDWLREYIYTINPLKTIKSGGDKNSNMLIFKVAQLEIISTDLLKITKKECYEFIKNVLESKERKKDRNNHRV